MEKKRKLIIAIDGPAGAGKSTVAAHLARSLGYINIETGAMYRALALKALEQAVAVDDEESLAKLAMHSRIDLQSTPEGNRVILDGREVTARIREGDVTGAASQVSVHPKVRAWMVARQREMGQSGGVVMEGRDIGTHVFPDADLKIFLDAAPEVRGTRRHLQSGDSGAQHHAVLKELHLRDHRDRNRAASPLTPASDAVVLDSTNLSLAEVMAKVDALVWSRLGSKQKK